MVKVSVIIPVYNGQMWISRCIDSVLQQTCHDIEIIIVDDGSTDGTAVICERFVQKDNRVKYIYQKNSGPDYARKTGVRESDGQLLMFVDADDYVDSEIVQKLYQTMQEQNCDIVCSQVKRISENGKIWIESEIPEKDIVCHSVRESMYCYFVKGYISGCYYAKLYRRNIFADYEFSENIVIGEDITAVLYAIQRAKSLYIMKEAYYYYYWNGKSISHSGYTERHYVSLQNYIKVRDSLLKKKYIDEKYIIGYFLEFEMAVATAMSRSWIKDEQAIQLLEMDIKKNLNKTMQNKNTHLYIKICILLFYISPQIFMALYRVVYLLTGR